MQQTQLLCVIFVTLGAAVMFFSIIRYYRALADLKKQTNAKRLFSDWIYLACMVMMIFFQLGYCAIIVMYINNAQVATLDLLISLIFMFGAVFVLAMVTMTRRMFHTMDDKEKLNDQLNQLRRMENEIVLARDLAEQGNRSKSEFLSRMSHEMRTPMNAIIGMTNIGLTTRDCNQKNYCLTKIQSASANLLELINNILDMSRIETYSMELTENSFRVGDMLDGVVNALKNKIDEKKLNLTLSLDQDLPSEVFADERRLSQVISNLVNNSIKFTKENGWISVTARKLREENGEYNLQFTIKDNGVGIMKDELNKIFQPFEQGDGSNTRKYGGAGLGLAISKHIVELMGGSISVESKLGQGTSFVFDVRLKAPPAAASAQGGKPAAAGGARRVIPFERSRPAAKPLTAAAAEDVAVIVNNENVAAAGAGLSAGGTAAAVKTAVHAGVNAAAPGAAANPAAAAKATPSAASTVAAANTTAVIPATAAAATPAATAKTAGDFKSYFAVSAAAEAANASKSASTAGANANKAAASAAGAADAGERRFEGKKLLVAEDIEINRGIITALFNNTGAIIEFALNGRMACEMFARDVMYYDLILMDMHLPGMSGLEAALMIRTLNADRAKTIPIIGMTAEARGDDAEKCMQAGMNDHVNKPLDAADVFEKIAKYI